MVSGLVFINRQNDRDKLPKALVGTNCYVVEGVASQSSLKGLTTMPIRGMVWPQKSAPVVDVAPVPTGLVPNGRLDESLPYSVSLSLW